METVSQQLIDRSLDLAAEWQQAADRLLTHEEKEQRDLLRRLLEHPGDIVILAGLFDRAFRIGNPVRVADLLEYLMETQGIPESFSTAEKALGLLFRGIGRHLPTISIPLLVERMRHHSRRLIIPGEPGPLRKYLERRRREGAQVNLNHLGEAVLGEAEAEKQLGRILVCVHPRDSLFEVLARIVAARVAGCGLTLNIPPDMDNPVIHFLEGDEGGLLFGQVDVVRRSSRGIVDMLPEVDRLRYAGADRIPPEIFMAAAELGRYIARVPVLMEGRLELLHYVVDRSICENYHRYGNLGDRDATRSPS